MLLLFSLPHWNQWGQITDASHDWSWTCVECNQKLLLLFLLECVCCGGAELMCVCESSLLQLQMLGIISNSVSSQSSPEVSLQSDSAEWRLMKDYDLLYCFRRDSNKVQNYLKILKCRIVPEHGCWGPGRSRGRLQLPETTHTQDQTIKAVAFVVFCMGTDANICSWSATGTQRLYPPPCFMPDTEITGYVVNVITDSCRM